MVTLLVPERLKANRAALLGRFVGGYGTGNRQGRHVIAEFPRIDYADGRATHADSAPTSSGQPKCCRMLPTRHCGSSGYRRIAAWPSLPKSSVHPRFNPNRFRRP